MKFQDQDFHYGAVLHQIIAHPVFTSINKVSDKDGLYLINRTKRLLIKCSLAQGPEWTFMLTNDDLTCGAGYAFFLALNCGGETVCLLSDADIIELIDTDAQSTQWIKVSYPQGGSMRVAGSLGALSRTIPHNAFPQELLGPVPARQEAYAWPPLSQLRVYDGPPNVLFSTEDRLADLADLLVHRLDDAKPTTLYLGLSTGSHKWNVWSEQNLRAIEHLIRDDLEFDGYKVKLERHTPATDPHTKKKDRPCDEQFVWKLTIKA